MKNDSYDEIAMIFSEFYSLKELQNRSFMERQIKDSLGLMVKKLEGDPIFWTGI